MMGRMCCQRAMCIFEGDLMLLMGATHCRWAAYPLGRYQRGTRREKRRNKPLNGLLHDAPLGHSSFLVVISFPLHHTAPYLCCPSSSLLRSLVSSSWQGQRHQSGGIGRGIAKTNHDMYRGSYFITHQWGIPLHGFPSSLSLPDPPSSKTKLPTSLWKEEGWLGLHPHF